ncbi:MAG: short-chain dehydrogenase [Cyanobacteria bacterium SW_7_48_12]|jgi:NAD(P)-dependent dehydrogenase (short-subunit alcohol dehydrogenase family)|nr:MAG: short-chain dehydrogenase [Cyanobacteria bacterium SW_7_48_12]
MARLDGKTALITGGTTGIGLETAKLFQTEGARIAFTGQNQERLNEAAQKLGSEAYAIRANMQSLADIEAMALQVKEQLGGLDVLFVNAGITKSASLAEVDEAHIDEQMGINFKGAFFTIQKVVPFIRDQGSIVLTTSCLNQMGMPGMSIYAASKAALRSLAQTLSAELTERGIRINAVSPGPIETPLYGKLALPQEALQQMAGQLVEKVPMRRFGQPEEIARAALFLASEDSSFMLGEELVVDGGWAEL